MDRAFLLCITISLVIAFTRTFANTPIRVGNFFTFFFAFPFWAVCLIFVLDLLYVKITNSYAYRLSRTLHLQHSYRPTLPRVNTAPPVEVRHEDINTPRDITSATPTSARARQLRYV